MTTPQWPPLAPDHPLLKFHSRLPALLESASHAQIWGVTLSPASPPAFSTLLILQKYLRSVAGDLDAAAAALEATLKWRKEFGLDQATSGPMHETFGDEFAGLGYITEIDHESAPGGKETVTWNIYGAVKDLEATFGDLDKFLRWRVALMERAILRLDLAHTTIPIPDHGAGDDPHRIAQVHVYAGLSFLRLDPVVKAASKATIDVMGKHYPETLSRKFFVGVPLVMSWVFTFVRVFVSAETAKKFVVVSYLTNLAGEMGDKAHTPVEYGGTGPGLAELQKELESRPVGPAAGADAGSPDKKKDKEVAPAATTDDKPAEVPTEKPTDASATPSAEPTEAPAQTATAADALAEKTDALTLDKPADKTAA